MAAPETMNRNITPWRHDPSRYLDSRGDDEAGLPVDISPQTMDDTIAQLLAEGDRIDRENEVKNGMNKADRSYGIPFKSNWLQNKNLVFVNSSDAAEGGLPVSTVPPAEIVSPFAEFMEEEPVYYEVLDGPDFATYAAAQVIY